MWCSVFLQVALYFDKFTGVCQTMLHECKLNFLQIISDHDLFVEMPGRDPSERCIFLDSHSYLLEDFPCV